VPSADGAINHHGKTRTEHCSNSTVMFSVNDLYGAV